VSRIRWAPQPVRASGVPCPVWPVHDDDILTASISIGRSGRPVSRVPYPLGAGGQVLAGCRVHAGCPVRPGILHACSVRYGQAHSVRYGRAYSVRKRCTLKYGCLYREVALYTETRGVYSCALCWWRHRMAGAPASSGTGRLFVCALLSCEPMDHILLNTGPCALCSRVRSASIRVRSAFSLNLYSSSIHTRC
jgi:hypothetical protein